MSDDIGYIIVSFLLDMLKFAAMVVIAFLALLIFGVIGYGVHSLRQRRKGRRK